MTPIILEDDPSAIGQAAEALARGEVVGIPTDTVYGLAVVPFRPDAVSRVFALKARPADVALPVLVGGWDQVELIADRLPVSAQNLADRFWPGALTLVVPRSRGFTADLGGRESPPVSVGLRWPDHPVVQALCAACGPLAVTSANRHGQPPCTEATQVAAAFTPPEPGNGSTEGGPGDISVGIVIDGGTCEGIPSTVVECRGPAARCLRDGSLTWSTLYPS
ncbi:MAG TPA: L-threonylcarbamoyladenylate synthase [Acidimicrobiales bacterium]|nr:L-threonylcarbamoyladenylate synthase [Acidimicrobiales bacterium]